MQQKTLQQLAACRLQLSYKRPANALHIAQTSHSVEMFRSVWDDSLMDIQEQCYVLYLGKSTG